MSRPTCCNANCNQGRSCPHRAAVPPTPREWLFAVGLLVVALVLSVLGSPS